MRWLEANLDSVEFTEWLAFYKVTHEIQSGTLPPREFDTPQEHAAALQSLFRKS